MTHRIAIVGGTGYIGRSLFKHFSSLGLESWIVGRRKKALLSNKNYRVLSDGLDTALEGATTVVHCVSLTTPETSYKHPELEAENVLFTIKLAKACVQIGVKNLIFASSGGTVYGQKNHSLVETDSLVPICSYGFGKVASESYLKLIASSSNLKTRILRIGNPYGCIDSDVSQLRGVVPYFVQQMIRGRPAILYGNTVRDFIYIDDLMTAFTASLEGFKDFDVLNVASGKGTSLKELLDVVAGVFGQQSRAEYFEIRPFDVSYNVLNIDKAKKQLAWIPKFNLGDGISKYVEMTKFMLKSL